MEGLDCYDTVLTYDEVSLIPVGPDTLIFDVAGNADVVAALHTRLGNTIPYSGAVGKTHWNAGAFGAHRDYPARNRYSGQHPIKLPFARAHRIRRDDAPNGSCHD